MSDIKRFAILAVAALFLSPGAAVAAGAGVPLLDADIDPDNVKSLQRGARNFMNYCSGCHSAKYVRYNTIGEDLELSEEQLIGSLMFNAEKTFETINVSMRPQDAERWFGVVPPDMSLIARSKGVDYIYSFLQGFYVDPERQTGVNNLYQTYTSMPHVLGPLQGFQAANFREETVDGATTSEFEGFELVTEGRLSAEEYDEFVRDTVNFLAYISEPIRSDRRKLGVWVLMFLIVFLVIAQMLKKQIWKDVK
jgi:ubiquinol-cytochrome c reductase cytochrome c1 subunit